MPAWRQRPRKRKGRLTFEFRITEDTHEPDPDFRFKARFAQLGWNTPVHYYHTAYGPTAREAVKNLLRYVNREKRRYRKSTITYL